MSSISTRHLLPALSAVAVAVSLAACDGSSSSSGSSAALESQAIDGYIVGATVMCDGDGSGATGAMGVLTCPDGTVLVKVRGGQDVGFDEDPSNDKPFVGQLLAPADLGYVTPLSTVAVEMSGGEDGFDASSFGGSVMSLGETLGMSGLDLGVNPAENLELAGANAKINQIITGFGATADDYAAAVAAMAAHVENVAAMGGQIDTTSGVAEIMAAINASLPAELRLGQADLDALVSDVAEINGRIDAARSPTDIGGEVAKSPVATPAMSIKRDATLMKYSADAGAAPVMIDLDGFESNTLDGDQYATVISGSGQLSIDQNGFAIDRTLDDKRVDLGFSLEATGAGDNRTLSVATTEARVDATEGDVGSLVVTMPAGSEVFVGSTSKSGTTSRAKITLENEHSFALDNGDVDVSFWRISDELEANGLNDITSERGNYEMTIVVGGVRIDETDGGERMTPTNRSVTAGNLSVSGAGFSGFVTVLPDAQQ